MKTHFLFLLVTFHVVVAQWSDPTVLQGMIQPVQEQTQNQKDDEVFDLAKTIRELDEKRRQGVSIGLETTIDGEFYEWILSTSSSDSRGDADGKFDIVEVSTRRKGDVLAIKLELDGEGLPNIQSGEESDGNLQMIVTDGQKNLKVDFRKRSFFLDGERLTWADFDFRCLPTYASNRYEMKLSLPDFDHENLVVDFSGSDSLDQPHRVNLELMGDRDFWPLDLSRQPNSFRIATLNTFKKGLTRADRGPALVRVLAHVEADVYAFQEETDEKSFKKKAVPRLLDVDSNFSWIWSSGCAIVSRTPIEKLPMDLDDGVAGLVTLKNGKQVVVMSVYLKSRGHYGSSEDQKRIRQAKRIAVEFKRMREGEFGTNAKDAPAIILGDFNLVGSMEPLQILLDAGLKDLVCMNPQAWDAVTWRDGESDFWPGRLDVLCHDQGVVPVRGQVFDSRTTPEDALGNVKQVDSAASDHLVLVGDFGFSDLSARNDMIESDVMKQTLLEAVEKYSKGNSISESELLDEIDTRRVKFPLYMMLSPENEEKLRNGVAIDDSTTRIAELIRAIGHERFPSDLYSVMLDKHRLGKLSPAETELLAQLLWVFDRMIQENGESKSEGEADAESLSLARLIGVWGIEKVEIQGNVMERPPGLPKELRIEGDEKSAIMAADPKTDSVEMKLNLDASTTPASLDLIREVNGVESSLPCIVEVDGDQLKLAMPLVPVEMEPGERLQRPESFDSESGLIMVFTAIREK